MAFGALSARARCLWQARGSKILGFRCLLGVRGGACGKPLGSEILGFSCLPGVWGGACGQPLGSKMLVLRSLLCVSLVLVANFWV